MLAPYRLTRDPRERTKAGFGAPLSARLDLSDVTPQQRKTRMGDLA
jgi:hypothetical protein